MFNRLYLHIPFCREKCHYCAFISRKPRGSELDDYQALLLKELQLVSAVDKPGQPLDSIYFGGGTPSLLSPQQVSRVMEQAAALFSLSPGIEITLEANPGTVDLNRLRDYRTAGVNRLSLGVQSFDDALLLCLGRVHDADQARRAFGDARQAGFGNIGIDLIHALPGQTLSQWRSELREAIRLSPEHISVYGLTIEEGTPFALRYPEDSPDLPDEEQAVKMFETADNILPAAGYAHYEIANYARDGYRSQHNSGYWRRDGYRGLGVAAHSFLRAGYGYRFSNPDTLEEYGSQLLAGRLPRRDQHHLTRQDAMAEFMFLGLRLAEGVSPERFEHEFGLPLDDIYGAVIAELIRSNLLQSGQDGLCLTTRGRLLSNQVFTRFLP